MHPAFALRSDASGRTLFRDQADLAVIQLATAPEGIAPIPLADIEPAIGERVTLVGVGSETCEDRSTDTTRRWGQASVVDRMLVAPNNDPKNFPAVFYTASFGDDALAVHGDSGGPALFSSGGTLGIAGVFSFFSCKSSGLRRVRQSIGWDAYTRLDLNAPDEHGVLRTYADWISRQLTDCSGEVKCTDRMRNGDETGVDCGGSCPPCPSDSGTGGTGGSGGASQGGDANGGTGGTGAGDGPSVRGADVIGDAPTFEDTAFKKPETGETLQWAMYLHVTQDLSGSACALDFPLVRRTTDDQFTARVGIELLRTEAELGHSDLPAAQVPAAWDGTWTRFTFSPCATLPAGDDIRFLFQDANGDFTTWPRGDGVRQARLQTADPNQYEEQLYNLTANQNVYIGNDHQMGYRIEYAPTP